MTRTEYLQEVKQHLPLYPICAEIGVYKGEFSALILKELLPGVLYLIDPFEVGKETYPDGHPTAYSTQEHLEEVKSNLCEDIFNGFVEIVKYDSVTAADMFIGECFDFIYIDASHRYEDVKLDLESYLPKMNEDSVIGGHDYFGAYSEGVKRAVDEFCEEHNFEIIILNPDGGDFALKRK